MELSGVRTDAREQHAHISREGFGIKPKPKPSMVVVSIGLEWPRQTQPTLPVIALSTNPISLLNSSLLFSPPSPNYYETMPNKTAKKNVRFTLDCSIPVDDNVLDLQTFVKFLTDRIKVNGKAGVLGDAVKVSATADNKIIHVDVKGIQFSKRYLKFLTKKYLKKQQLRDYLHVIASNASTYQLRYFNIVNDEEDVDEDEE